MQYTADEVLQFTRENDVKFIRLAFCDAYGVMKNLSIMPSELERAFRRGIDFDASAIPGFSHIASMLVLKPDPSTLAVLPWRPSQGRVIRMFCHIFNQDGSSFIGDFRRMLIDSQNLLAKEGLNAKIGIECEFYLFELDENGYATTTPHDKASYFDIAPRDRGENVRRDICLTLETMGVDPLTSHHERGPGQHEVSFKYASPLVAADQFLTFKSIVKMIAERNGLHASFMPKPLKIEHGSGMHINFSLYEGDENLYETFQKDNVINFTQSLISYLPDFDIFLNPLTNSFSRLREQFSSQADENSQYAWLRIIKQNDSASRLELRFPDPTINPYIVFALLMQAGINDPSKLLEKGAVFNLNAILEYMPLTLERALHRAKSSEFLNDSLPKQFLKHYFDTKHTEWLRVEQSSDHHDQEMAHYFDASYT